MPWFPLPRATRIAAAALLSSAFIFDALAEEAPAPPAASASAAQRLPVEAFANLPRIRNVVLSPNGKKVAALLNRKDGTLLITREVGGSGAAQAAVESDNIEFRFNWARWVNDERLLVSVSFADYRGTVATVERRLFSVKADGSGLVNLVRTKRDKLDFVRPAASAQFQDQVIDWMPEDGHHVLLALSESGGLPPAVYKVDVDTAARQIVHGTDRDTYDWMTDAQHRVRIGVRSSEEGRFEVRACDPDGGNWRTLWAFARGEKPTWPLGFGVDPQELFVRADHEGRSAVFSVRLDQPDLPKRLRVAHATYDVDGDLIILPASHEVLGVRSDGIDGTAGDTRGDLWNPSWRELMQAIDRGMPDSSNRLTSIGNDEQHYVVYASGNGKPGQYYIGDRSTGRLNFMGDTYPELDPAVLVGKRRARIAARDGLELNVYLTMPLGRRAGDQGAPLPFVLLPHGGPGSRDDTDFDYWTEFLANRGYGVLQVNFRGSRGYGRDFQSAGLQRWGARDAGRPDRCRQVGRRSGPGRSETHLHRRRKLRRLCRADGGGEDARPLPLRGEFRRRHPPSGSAALVERLHRRPRCGAGDHRRRLARPRAAARHLAGAAGRAHQGAGAAGARQRRPHGAGRPGPRHGERFAQCRQALSLHRAGRRRPLSQPPVASHRVLQGDGGLPRRATAARRPLNSATSVRGQRLVNTRSHTPCPSFRPRFSNLVSGR
jgi:dipeptidyl aminopeptidase/acylaminoacyl peptidase